jgi:hypothetical protein
MISSNPGDMIEVYNATLVHMRDTEGKKESTTREMSVWSVNMQVLGLSGVTPRIRHAGGSRDTARLNFHVFMNYSTSTIRFLKPIAGLWSGNFCHFFDGGRKNFGVVGAKLRLL